MELLVLNNKLPLKAYPEKDLDQLLTTQFKYWLGKLLNMKEGSEEKVDDAIQAIKKKFWSLGLDEIQTAFEMYALGELGLTPKSNYLDVILVGQIFNAYKKQQRTKPKKMDEDAYKKQQDDLLVIQAFDAFKQDRKVHPRNVWMYYYLEEAIGATKREKMILWKLGKDQKLSDEDNKQVAMLKLLARFFEKLEAKGEHIKKYL